MHTFGSILLALIGVIVMQLLMGLLGGLLGGAIANTTGIIWIPALIMAALNGCAIYAGVYFALRVAKEGNPKITSIFIVIVIFITTAANTYNTISSNEPNIWIGLIALYLNSAAGVLGGWIAYMHIIGERTESALDTSHSSN